MTNKKIIVFNINKEILIISQLYNILLIGYFPIDNATFIISSSFSPLKVYLT